MPRISGVLGARGQVGSVLATAAGGAALPWYDPNGVFAADGGNLYAWRAQNSVGTVWPGGPANYAATLTDEASGVVLVEGNGVLPWAAATGWDFVAAAAQYFDTGRIPANDQSWSMFVQFSDVPGIVGYLAGGLTAGIGSLALYIDNIPGLRRIYYNGKIGGVAIPGAATTSGNMGIAGVNGYYNGAPDAGPVGAWGGVPTSHVYIGARSTAGVPLAFVTAKIQAVWIYDQNPALVQAQAVLIDGFRAAMGQL